MQSVQFLCLACFLPHPLEFSGGLHVSVMIIPSQLGMNFFLQSEDC